MGKKLKRLGIFVVLLLSGYFLWAQEKKPDKPEKKPFRFNNRMVELSVPNINLFIANDSIAYADVLRNPFYLLWNICDIIQDPVLIYQDSLVINLDNFLSGFKFDFGVDIKPVTFSFNWKDKWGFGLDIGHIDILGNFSLPENLLTLDKTEEKRFGVGLAVFADVGIPVFFHVDEFKIKLRPAVYLPVIYAKPGITYRRKDYIHVVNGQFIEGTRIDLDYDVRVYSIVNMQEIQDLDIAPILKDVQNNYWNILRNNLGYDFGLSVEYPWDYWLDIGVDIVNIPVPFAAAKLNHYAQLSGKAWVDTGTIDLGTFLKMQNATADTPIPDGYQSWDEYKKAYWAKIYGYPEGFTPEFKADADGVNIYRPFKMLFYVNYLPSDSFNLVLIPSLGFSLNWLYPQIAAVEGGLSARFDSANVFVTTIGINYNDRKWKNSLDFMLNLRAFELDLGLSMQSPSFVQSWRGAGLGINLALKFGW